MNDDVDVRLHDGLRGVLLPAAPEALRDYLVELGQRPSAAGRHRRGPLLLVALVPIAAILLGIIAVVGGSSPKPSPTSSPTASPASSPSASEPPQAKATFPATVDGLTIQTVSQLLAARAAGQAKGGPYALGGYWTDRDYGHMCGIPRFTDGNPGELELWCSDGDWGITERDEPIKDLTIKHQANETTIGGPPAAGPHLTPWVPSDADQKRLFAQNYVNGQFWPPVPIVVVGHFDDPKAADCRKSARQLCLDRFVIDRVVMYDPDSVPAPTPSPSPTPFPVADPPPALFTSADCYGGVPKSFAGWKLFSDLDLGIDGPGYVYAMITRDVIPLGDWWQNLNYPGHKTRPWGQGICYAVDSGGVGFGSVTGSGYLEIDDGRHIVGTTPGPTSAPS